MSGDTERQGIAIIGMACRFPGANDLASFWENLEAGIDSIRHFSDAELLSAGVSEKLLARPNYVKAAPVIDGFDLFDAGFFEYSAREARLMDPQQRILLEEAWHALEDAGWPPAREAGRVGVFAGSGGVVTSYLLAHRSLHGATTGGLEHLANDKDFLATRLSYKLGLTGPSVNVQTACSTSLVAVHLACQSILDGECDMALAGGSTVRVPQVSGYIHRQGDIMSPDGRCRAYDAAAEGTVFGSGTGVVVLKHVEDAIADGDRIYAVILGSAVNNDGAAKVSYTASSTEGQARAMAGAFAAAGVAPSTIAYVEGHGTGTVVGDPLEVEALRRCFATDPETRPGGCLLGSVKTNIGHLEQAAGVASLIKAALAVHHGRVPPSLNFNEPNPRIDFAGGPFRVPVAAIDWAGNGAPRRAAVNSLGLGGTNAFAILEEAPAPVTSEIAPPPVQVLALSARSRPAMERLVDRWRNRLAGLEPQHVADACFTAAKGRAEMKYRRAVAAPDTAGLARGLIETASEPAEVRGGRRLAFLFPGQGAQYPGMARAFYDSEPGFRAAFDAVAARLREKDGPDIAALVFGQDDAVALARTEAQQPALFAIEWALAEMLGQWGVRPDAVLGHSVGAFAAAAVAGIYDPGDAADLIAERGALMGALPGGGAMAALFTHEAEAADLCGGIDGVVLAALNSPSNTVISGEAAAVAKACERAGEAGVAARRLAVSHAFHSPLMQPAAGPLAALAAERPARAPQVAFVSDSTGEVLAEAPSPEYLSEHLLNPVRFADGLRALAALGCTDFVEIGPGASLRGFAAATLADEAPEVHGLLDPKGGDWEATARTLGRLWERGYPADLARYHGGEGRRLVAAPLYSFEPTRYWLNDNGARKEDADGAGLAGSEVRVPGPARHFQGRYSAAARPWLPDHRVYGHVTLPVAAAMAGLAEAGASVVGATVEVRDLTYQEASVLADDEELLLDLEVPGELDAGQAILRSARADGSGPWREHVRATLGRSDAGSPEAADLAALRAAFGRRVEPGAFYAVLDRLGLNYGSGFRNVRELCLGEGEALGRITLAEDAPEAGAAIHPAMLDSCLHLFSAVSGLHGDFARAQEGEGVTFLPITVERFAVFGDMSGTLWSHCILRDGERPEDGRYTLDVRIYADDGAPAAVIEGLTVKRLPEPEFLPRRKAPVEDWLHGLDWIARPALPEPEAVPEGRWLVIAEDPADVRAVTEALEAAGAACQVLPAAALTGAEASGGGEAAVGDGPVAGVLLATALSAPPLMALDSKDLAVATERQFRVAKAVLGLVSERLHGAGDQPRIRILTRGAQAPLDDRLGGEALQSMLWGYGRVIALEHPSLYGGMIDLDDRTDAAAVVREILSSDGEDQVALRDGRRYVPRLVRRVLEGPGRPVQPPIRPDRSYLVTGGLGTLGLKVADWLAAQGARHVWLVSRRAPSEEQRTRIAELEALGASVHVVSADVSDPAQVSALVGRIGEEAPALDGVFHCAGLLDDGIMLEMNWERFHRVTAAKVEGAWALHLATEALGLGHFVVFSSILSVIGSMGQLNYVAGNAFLDALIAYRRRLGLSATAMNWGPWEEAGLATESGERGRAIWRARGTQYIPVEEGMEAMTRALAHGFDHLVVTLTDWSRFVAQFAETPKLYEGLAGSGGAGCRRSRMGRAAMIDRLNAAPAEERHGVLVEALGEICAGVLEADAPPDPDVSLREAGLDSLMSITLINEIESVFGTRLAARALLRGPSVAELAEMLVEAQPALRGSEEEGAGAISEGEEPQRKAQRPAKGDGRTGSWLVVKRPRPEARVRLVCFPFAGGGSAVFDHWGDAFDPAIEIVAVEPPGRLSRINEKPVTTVEAFARGLLPELRERLDRPYAVLGHCLGGLTLYETLRFLDARDHPLPTHIFISGARPPSALRAPGDFERELDARLRRFVGYRAGRPGFEQPDDVFSEIIRAFGIADSATMLEEEELRDIVLPTVRAEFAMANRYIYLPESPFPVPITCFRGARDDYFREIDAQVWRRFTSKRFELFTRDTGHFAIVEDFDFIRWTIETRLLGQAAARP